MIMCATDPRDERFLRFLLESEAAIGRRCLPLPERIERLSEALGGVSEAVEARRSPEHVAAQTLSVAGWALSPDPSSLEAWALDALRSLRKDPIRARNISRGIVDWVMGQLRAHTADLRNSWQALIDTELGYPGELDPNLLHPALGSGRVAAWSYALLRAAVAQHARGIRDAPTTLAQAAAARQDGPL